MQRFFSLSASLVFSAASLLCGPGPARAAAPPVRPVQASAAPQPTDTIVIRLPNQAVLTLLVRDAAQLRELKKYQLDSLTGRLAGYINQAEAAARAGNAEGVTMEFYPDKDRPGQNLPEQIRVTSHKAVPGQPYTAGSRMEVFLKRKFNVQVERDADGEKSFSINGEKVKTKPRLSPADSVRHLYGRDKHVILLHWDGGINNFANTGRNATGDAPGLRVFGSGYLNLGFNYVVPVRYEKHSRLALTLGPEVTWNTFRLQGDNVWSVADGRTLARPAPANQQIDEARLLLTTLNLPLMLEYKRLNAKGNRTLTVGGGGFGGYRLYSSSRTKYKLAGTDYDREDVASGGFGLNDWQYGLQAELGYGFFRFQGRYHLNSMFRADQGPQAQIFSVGFKVFGF